MPRQYWSEALVFAVASGTAVANLASETILVPNTTVPANFMQDGRVLRVSAFGGYGTHSTGTLTILFQVRWGGVAGTVLAKSSTPTLAASVGGGASMTALWAAEFLIQTRSNGSSGTLMTNGLVTLGTASAATQGTVTNYGMVLPLVSGSTGGSTPATATVDLTADTALSFTVTHGAANAANSIQCHQFYIESLN